MSTVILSPVLDGELLASQVYIEVQLTPLSNDCIK